MTREEEHIVDAIRSMGLFRTCFDNDKIEKLVLKAIKSLEAWDKVCVEIADIYCRAYCDNPYTAYQVREIALEIVEKYLNEVEE